MKCIKHLLTQEVVRVSDEDAAYKIAARKHDGWQYCPKHEWKAYRDRYSKEQQS